MGARVVRVRARSFRTDNARSPSGAASARAPERDAHVGCETHLRARRAACREDGRWPSLPKSWRGTPTRPSGALRIVLGAKLRRALRRRDPIAQLGALIDILRNPEAAIAGLAKRLARGMRRRRGAFVLTAFTHLDGLRALAMP